MWEVDKGDPNAAKKHGLLSFLIQNLLTLIRMTKDEKGFAFYEGFIALKCLKCQKIKNKYLILL